MAILWRGSAAQLATLPALAFVPRKALIFPKKIFFYFKWRSSPSPRSRLRFLPLFCFIFSAHCIIILGKNPFTRSSQLPTTRGTTHAVNHKIYFLFFLLCPVSPRVSPPERSQSRAIKKCCSFSPIFPHSRPTLTLKL